MVAWKGLFVYLLYVTVLCIIGVFKVMPDHSLFIKVCIFLFDVKNFSLI